MSSKENNAPVFISGLRSSGKTSLLTALITLGAQKLHCSYAGAKFFDFGQSKINADDVLTDGEKIIKVMSGAPTINLISPYHAYSLLPLELSFKYEMVKIDWSFLENNLMMLNQQYERIFLETPPGLFMPITEEERVLTWMEKISKNVIWVMHVDQENFAENLSELEHLKRNNFQVKIILNNSLKIIDTEFLYYVWNKVQDFSVYPVLGLIPFVPNLEENFSLYCDKVEENARDLFDFDFTERKI